MVVADFCGALVLMRPCILSRLTHLGGLGLGPKKATGAGSAIHLSWLGGGRPNLESLCLLVGAMHIPPAISALFAAGVCGTCISSS